MFTIAQIESLHSKVKTGADFPTYIQDIIKLGVVFFETYVKDGHTDYFGKGGFVVSTHGERADIRMVEEKSQVAQFQIDLKKHQQGKTDYAQFCNDCAKAGIEKWKVDTLKRTCAYYDRAGNEVLIEHIPGVA